jgi:hypothetical protein
LFTATQACFAATWACPPQLRVVHRNARRLGLVRRPEMIAEIDWAVENPAEAVRMMNVERIRSFRTARS